MSEAAPDPDFDSFQREGCPEAFGALVSRHLPSVRAAARRVLGARLDLADDVAQQVFVVLARKGRGLPEGIVLGAWLHRQAVRLALNEVRSATRRTKREQRATEMQTIENQTSGEEPAWVEVMPRVDRAILELPDDDQSALALRFGEGCKVREVAERLGLSTAAAEKRIARALEKLRGRLSERGVVPSAVALGSFLSQGAAEAASPSLAGAIAQNATGAIGTGGSGLLTSVVVMTATKSLIVGGIVGLIFGGTLVAWSSSRPQDSRKEREEESRVRAAAPVQALPRAGDAASRWSVPKPGETAEEVFEQVRRLLGQPDNEISRQRMRGLFAAIPADQFGELFDLAEERFFKWWELNRVLPELASAWAAEAPIAAMDRVIEVESRRSAILEAAFGVWHRMEPEAAREWLVEQQESSRFGSAMPTLVAVVARDLADEDVVAWAGALRGEDIKEAALSALWTEYTNDHYDAEHADAFARLIGQFAAIDDRELSQFAVRKLARTWAENRYRELANWLKTQMPGPAAYEAALAAVQVADMMQNDGFSRSGARLSTGERLRNAERAMMLAGDRPESEVAAEIVGGMKEIERGVAKWALPKLTGPERDETIVAAAYSAMEWGMWGDYPSPRVALDWVVHHSDPVKRDELVAQFYGRWLSESPYKGAEKFPAQSGWSDELKAVLHRVAEEHESR